MPNLVWLRTFEASARLLNFTEAGRDLGLTQTAVSLHIKSLESTLGCQLFLRKPRKLELTDMGQAYVHTVRKALADINLATTSLFGSVAKQTITVRAPISTATLWLAPLLPTFLAAHPGINIRLVSTIWANSIADEDVDIDLRIGYGDWSGMQVEKISTETIIPVCATDVKKTISSPADLLHKPLIHILGHEDNWDNYLTAQGLTADSSNIRYMVDTTAVALALAAAGGGIATILTRFVESAVASGHTVVTVGEPVEFPQSHYLTNPVNHDTLKPEVALVKEWIKSCF
jgi:LysR family glycine cleavage system transcriptional activator